MTRVKSWDAVTEAAGVEQGTWAAARAHIIAAAPAALVWATFSFGLSYYNSWLLNRSYNRFPFPLFYTFWHMVTQGIAMQIVFAWKPHWQRPSMAQFRAQWRMLLGMAVISVISVGGENSALTQVTLTVHESVKSAVPILTMVLAFLFEGRYYKVALILSVIGLAVCTGLVTTGAIIHGRERHANTTTGVLLTVMASAAASARPVIFALLMRVPQDGGEHFSSPLVVVWYEALFGTPMYVVAWLLSDERTTSLAFCSAHPAASLAYNAAGCAMAIFYSVALNELIHVTSSLTTTVLGTAKHVVMATVAAAFVDHMLFPLTHSSLIPWLGLLGYIPSTTLYAYLMLTHQGVESWSYRGHGTATCFVLPSSLGCHSSRSGCCGKRSSPGEGSALLAP